MKQFDLQGHRGARGLMPENTIPAFITAMDLGVNTLEMDLAVTKDKELLVSHEPYMAAEYCLDPQGNEIADSVQKEYNVFQMGIAEIEAFDCGMKPHPRFPKQKKMEATKPLLSDLITAVEDHIKTEDFAPVNYNIEIKSTPEGDGIFHPKHTEFSDLVFEALNERISWERITIQSFDFRVLQYFHQAYPKVRLAALVENELSIEENLSNLGFTPEIYSCEYVLLSRQKVSQLHELGIKVIPWTVNEISEMKRLIAWGVDGLITDYPNRYNQIDNE
ncbi:MAG: glycerophosphodiester phosphodiesterase family protein [Cyclobacteriaceae bacterium]